MGSPTGDNNLRTGQGTASVTATGDANNRGLRASTVLRNRPLRSQKGPQSESVCMCLYGLV